MPGFQKYLSGNSLLLLFAVGLAVLAGCSGGDKAGRSEKSVTTLESFLAEHERSFDPSRYEMPTTEIRRQMELRAVASDTSAPVASLLPDTIPGFRVQILMTEDIDKAAGVRDSAMARLPDEWVYIVYDAPNYKVRVGDYVDRPAGNRMAAQLVRMGYVDSWVVPDLIIRNAPPRTGMPSQNSPAPEEPQRD